MNPQNQLTKGKTAMLTTFKFDGREVRTVGTAQDPCFVARDVAEILGISQPNLSQRLSRISEEFPEWVGDDITLSDAIGRDQSYGTIREPALYELIFRSDVPQAKGFKKWVFEAVLPQIRKAGSYRATPELPQSLKGHAAQLAGAAASHRVSEKDLIDLPSWLSVTEMLAELGHSQKDEDSLSNDSLFRYWINRHLSDLYRSQCGEEPPSVYRKKTSSFVYPPDYLGIASYYVKRWETDYRNLPA
jgi:prophage antirepressor-like protein